GLQAELPLRVGEAEADRPFGIAGAVRSVHRLYRKAMKVEPGKVERVEPLLRYDDLQLVPAGYHERRVGLWADADPVDARRRNDRAVGLDRDLETAPVQRLDQRRIKLQQRLAASADDKLIGLSGRPQGGNGIGQHLGISIAAALRAAGPDEIGIAE